MRRQDISNTADMIDGRDILRRISDLEGQLEDEYNTEVDEHAAAVADATDLEEPAPAPMPADFEEWIKVQADNSNDDATELVTLRALRDEVDSVSGDTCKDGAGLIADSYFEQYARDLHEDINGRTAKGWPYTCIDWEQAASDLQHDYSSVDYDGETYWVRS